MFEFSCPHCSMPLRLRDRSLRGRTIPCPDCHQPLTIEEVEGSLHAVPARANKAPQPQPPTSPAQPNRLPQRVAGGVAAVLVLLLAGYILSGLGRVENTGPAAPSNQPEVADGSHRNVDNRDQKQSSDDTPSPPVRDAAVDQRVQQIYDWIAPTTARGDQFPQSGSQNFSWIAALAEQQLPATPWHPDQSWNAAPNSDFVRRRFPAFQNPDLPTTAGDDGFPPTHFVGVSGVGNDAAHLRVTHPRAGIFGQARPTRSSDVQDGLSNTILVAGVQSRLGSWARPGEATVRSFQQEPYVNGPDGFGTGQTDGMFVLMADGSVRFLDANTDPVVLRRMAAMADGLSLDSEVVGDPLTLPDPEAAVANASEDPTAPEKDATSEVTSEVAGVIQDITGAGEPEAPPTIDVDRQLAQKVLRFRQPHPVEVGRVLFELQELMGVPIDVTRLSPEMKQKLVRVNLEQASLLEILQEVTERTGLSYELAPAAIIVMQSPEP